jgi:predicted branched-subunit amino acid permease
MRAHYAGAAGAVTVGWTAAVTAGMVLGRGTYGAEYLAVAVPMCLVVLVAPHLRLPGGVAAVVAGGAAAVAARPVLPGFELLVAMAAAAVAGVLSGRHSGRGGRP